MLIAADRMLRRSRRRLAVAGAVLAVGSAVALAHGGLSAAHGAMPDAMAPVVGVCLAVVGLGAAAAAIVLLARLGGRLRAPVRTLAAGPRSPSLLRASLPRPRARASPAFLQVIRR